MQPTRQSADYWTPGRIAVAAGIVAVIGWLVFRGSSLVAIAFSRIAHVLVTLILAAALAYIVWPAVIALERCLSFLPARPRRILSALVVIVAFIGAVVALVVVTAAPLVAELRGLGALTREWLLQLPGQIDRLGTAFGKYLPPETIDVIRERAMEYTTTIFAAQADAFKRIVVRGWYVIELFVVPVLAFYFVTDGAALAEQFVAGLPAKRRERARAMGAELNALMHSYVRAQAVMCFIMAVSTSLLLYAAGIRVYLTLGLLAGVGWAVPILGPILAGVPIVAVCLLQQGLQTAVVVLVVYAAINVVQSKLIMPNVLSAGARLHPVIILVSLLIGAEFLGVLGMFIAVPAAAALRVLATHLRAGGKAPGDE